MTPQPPHDLTEYGEWTVPIKNAGSFGKMIQHGISDELVIVLYRGIHGLKTPEGILSHVRLPHQLYLHEFREITVGGTSEIVVVGLKTAQWKTVWASARKEIFHK